MRLATVNHITFWLKIKQAKLFHEKLVSLLRFQPQKSQNGPYVLSD